MRSKFRRSVRESVLLLGLAGSVLPSSSAQADLCGDYATPQSCYTLRPDLKLVTQGTSTLPLGSPVPYHWHEATKQIDPPSAKVGEYVTRPGLTLNLAVGVFGVGPGEPMALARTTFRYTTATSVPYISPTNGSNGVWYRFPCEEGTPLCYRDTSSNTLDVWKNGVAILRRRYRLTKINPGTLPATVTHVPLVVDYRMAHVVEGTYRQGGMTVPGLRSKTTVAFGEYSRANSGAYNFRGATVQGFGKLNSVECWGTDGNFVDPTGRTCAGSFRRQASVAAGDMLGLIATAELIIDTAPACEQVDTPDGPQCLVKPWSASGHAIADPYVFIDPAWAHASWFKLEVSADETDTVWATPERSAIDPETLTLLDGGAPSGDAGSGASGDGGASTSDSGTSTGDSGTGTDGDASTDDSGNGAGDGDASTGDDGTSTGDGDDDGDSDGDGNTGGDGDSSELDAGTKGTGKKGGGGCQLSGSSTFTSWLSASLLGAALLRRRRRAGSSLEA